MTQKRFQRFQHREGSFPDRYDAEPRYTARPAGRWSGARLAADFSPEIWARERLRVVALGQLSIFFYGSTFAGVAIAGKGDEHFSLALCPWFERAVEEVRRV